MPQKSITSSFPERAKEMVKEEGREPDLLLESESKVDRSFHSCKSRPERRQPGPTSHMQSTRMRAGTLTQDKSGNTVHT